mmetsp:Transcript_5111/g.8553  ORF Transcript_5111/g.8553 Transcript_5111/m.8553 type:complete len:112 (-) Transcript_5111:416-751(-)
MGVLTALQLLRDQDLLLMPTNYACPPTASSCKTAGIDIDCDVMARAARARCRRASYFSELGATVTRCALADTGGSFASSSGTWTNALLASAVSAERDISESSNGTAPVRLL